MRQRPHAAGNSLAWPLPGRDPGRVMVLERSVVAA
jgi:hypothetical protein